MSIPASIHQYVGQYRYVDFACQPFLVDTERASPNSVSMRTTGALALDVNPPAPLPVRQVRGQARRRMAGCAWSSPPRTPPRHGLAVAPAQADRDSINGVDDKPRGDS